MHEVWHFKEAGTDLIESALNDFNWESAFSNTNVNEKVFIFNKSVLNVLRMPRGLTLEGSLFYEPKIKFSKIIEKIKLIFNCLKN